VSPRGNERRDPPLRGQGQICGAEGLPFRLVPVCGDDHDLVSAPSGSPVRETAEQQRADVGPVRVVIDGEVVNETGQTSRVVNGRRSHRSGDGEASYGRLSVKRHDNSNGLVGHQGPEELSLLVHRVAGGPPELWFVVPILPAPLGGKFEHRVQVGGNRGPDSEGFTHIAILYGLLRTRGQALPRSAGRR
jgi:hypothetical protein